MEKQVVQAREVMMQDEVKTVGIAASQSATEEMLKLARYGVIGFETMSRCKMVSKESSMERRDMKIRNNGQHIQILKTTTQRWYCSNRAAACTHGTSSISKPDSLSEHLP